MNMNNLDGKKVLVTGAGGFIGSRLTEVLVENGCKTRVFVRYTSRSDIGLLKFLSRPTLSELEVIRGDLTDEDALEGAARGVDLIFHLGALISIPYSYVHPVETVETNILGTLNVLQACRRQGCRLIHTSSSEVYGSAQRVPIDEDHPLQGQSPYSASKIGADKLVESYVRSFGVDALMVRPFNTYGPGQSSRAVIPTIIAQALTREVIELGNLNTLRDFTYVDDTVAGFLAAARAEGLAGETINLGTGTEISIGELAEKIIRMTGSSAEVRVKSQRLRPEKSEVTRLLSDNRKARALLGWQPTVDLEAGLSRTIAWVREHPDFYQPLIYGV
jgi:dTDP-glucose 4,6-dehydratase